MKTALVTGGAGFIGSHVVDELLKDGLDVAILDNFENGKRDHVADLPDEKIYRVDITDRLAVEKVILDFKPALVFHLAAIHFIPYCIEHPIRSLEINAMGTKNLLDALKSHSLPECVFLASTAAVYGPKDTAHLESDPTEPMEIYGVSKVCAEAMMTAFALENEVQVTIGRLFNAVGPRETNPHLLPDLLNQLNAGKRTVQLGNLEPKRDFIHVRDMAEAIKRATIRTQERCSTFNIGSGVQYSVKDVVEICGRIIGQDIAITQNEKFMRKVERPYLLAGIDQIKKEIEWEPRTTLEITLTELLG